MDNPSAWWYTVLSVAVLVILTIVWGQFRARQCREIAKQLGFKYRAWKVPETLHLSGASFWNSGDFVTNVIAGSYNGMESAVFHFHANHGEMGYKQTTAAVKSGTPIAQLSSLWIASGIVAERVGDWIVMFRPKETIAPPEIPGFLDDCGKLLQYFKEQQELRETNGMP